MASRWKIELVMIQALALVVVTIVSHRMYMYLSVWLL